MHRRPRPLQRRSHAPAADASTTSTVPAPSRIVSLSPTATEMLFAIGAGDQVLAVDDQSNYPAEALEKPHDLSGFEPNVEAIAALEARPRGHRRRLHRAHQAARGARPHGRGVGPAATRSTTSTSRSSSSARSPATSARRPNWCRRCRPTSMRPSRAAPKPAQPLTYYHELDNTYYSVTENTFIGQVYSLFGLQSIADFAGGVQRLPAAVCRVDHLGRPRFDLPRRRRAAASRPRPSRHGPAGSR